jgi:Domain of unknown function (DUF4192)
MVAGMTQHHEYDAVLAHPGALIAALPAILGFVPVKSLVLASMERGELGAVLRADLSENVIEDIDHLVQVVANARPEAVIAVVVDAEGAGCPSCLADHHDLMSALAAALAAVNITLADAHVVDVIGPGGRWYCADGCGARGVIDDPQVSPLAAAAVVQGRRLYGSREELTAVIAVEDERRTAVLARLIGELDVTGSSRGADDPGARTRQAVRSVLDTIGRVADGAVLVDAELAELGHTLTDIDTRDILYALAVGAIAGDAESLWAVLARTLPGRGRVEALVLLAFSAYARGDGPLAGIALEEAVRRDPEHRMATMLDTALHAGMRPERIRELAMTGYRLADRIGAVIPAPARRRAG